MGEPGREQLATLAACGAQGQAVLSDCWVEVGGRRLWRGGCMEEEDKSLLIKAMRAEMDKNLN